MIWAVFFGGLWLAAEGDHETLRGMAFFLPFALVFGIDMFLESVDREAAERRRNESSMTAPRGVGFGRRAFCYIRAHGPIALPI